MAYDEGRRQVGNISARQAESYARKHGHEFACVTENIIPAKFQQSAYWLKVHVVERELMAGGCDWVLWLDSDAMIADLDFDLSALLSKTKNFVCSTDYNGLCVGVFLLRNCEWSRDFLRTLKWLGYYTRHGSNSDQATFQQLVSGWSSVGVKTTTISDLVVQNPSTRTGVKPFVFHYWTQWNGTATVAERMALVAERGWTEEARLLNSQEA